MKAQSVSNKKDVLKMSNIESNLFTKECIITALLQLLNETPFEKITDTAIIERSGVSRAGFYRNYSSKEKVLEELAILFYNKLTDILTDTQYQANPRQWFINLFNEEIENEAVIRLLIEANVPNNYILSLDNFSQNIYPINSSKDRYFVVAFSSFVKEICLDWLKHGTEETPEELADIVIELLQI